VGLLLGNELTSTELRRFFDISSDFDAFFDGRERFSIFSPGLTNQIDFVMREPR